MRLAILIFSVLATASAASIGSEHCTWGPAYWCDHPVKAKECGEGATTYCIQNDWAQIKLDEGAACDDCELFVGGVKDVLNSGEVQTEIVSVVKGLCDKLGSKATICKLAVDMYGIKFLEALVTELDADKVCTLLDLCDKAASPNNGKDTQILLPHIQADPCKDCQQVFDDLKDILSNDTVQQFVFKEAIMLCVQPGLPSELCQMYVDDYGPMVVKYILQLVDGKTLCKDLGICNGVIAIDFAKKVSKVKADPCNDCKQIFSDLADILKNQSVQQFVANELQQTCSQLGLPSSICQEIPQYAPLVFDYIVSLLDGSTICRELGMCMSGTRISFQPLQLISKFRQAPVANADSCTECKQMITDLADILNDESVQANLFNTLTKVCEALGVDPDVCSSDIQQYGATILQFITSELDGNVICPPLHLCGAGLPLKMKHAVSTMKQIVHANGDVCSECTEMIADLADILSNATFQNTIFQALTSICTDVGVPSDTCKSYIQNYGALVLDLVVQYLTPDVCSSLGLCSSTIPLSVGPVLVTTQLKQMPALKLMPASPVKAASHQPVASQLEGHVGASVECVLCEFIMEKLETMLAKNATEKEIEDALMKVCSLLPASIRTECDDFVEKYAPQVIAIFTTLGAKGVCVALGVCQPTAQISPPVKAQVGQSVSCEVCTYVLGYLESELAKNATEKEIVKALDKVCSHFPASISNECDQLIAEYASEILKLLVNSIPPSKVCAALKLCTSAKTQISPSVKAQVGQPVSCEVCKYVLGFVETELGKNATEQEVEKALDKVCSYLPASYKGECDDFVTQYTPEILELLKSIPPSEVCAALKLCTSAKKVEVDSSAECMICELIVKEIRSGLSQNATEAEIQKFLGTVCSKIPLSSYAKECQEFVTDYTQPLVNFLLSEMDPDTVCDFLKVCTSSSIIKPGLSGTKVESGSLCTVCDVLFGILETQVEQNKTVEEITGVIEKVCTILPSDLGKQCKGFLDIYGPVLLKLIVNSELSPNSICKDLKLCTSTVRLPVKLGADDCALCKELVSLVESYLNKDKDLVLDELAKLCTLLPAADQATCKNGIAVYGSYILDLLLNELLTPDGVCKDLKLCSAAMVAKEPIRAECMQGPAFWCASMDNAKLCHTVEHCRRHAWN